MREGTPSRQTICVYLLCGPGQFLALSGLSEFQGWEAKRSRVASRLPGI